jgi:hypothetical protein
VSHWCLYFDLRVLARYVLLLHQPWAMAISSRSSLVYLNFYSCNYVAIKLSCFSRLSTSHRVQSNHATVVAATRNNAVWVSSQPPRFRCLVFSGSQVLERVDFVRCDKHVLRVSVKAEWNRLCLFGQAEDEGLA